MAIIIANRVGIVRHHLHASVIETIQTNRGCCVVLIHEAGIAVPKSVKSSAGDPQAIKQRMQFAFHKQAGIPGRSVPRAEYEARIFLMLASARKV